MDVVPMEEEEDIRQKSATLKEGATVTKPKKLQFLVI